MCVRDYEGRYIHARTEWKSFLPNVQEGEALGILCAIKWLLAMQVEHFVIEWGYSSIVNAISNNKADNSELGIIISQCRDLLLRFSSCQVSFIRRQANSVAHSLARASRFYANPHVFDYIPYCIANLISNDMI